MSSTESPTTESTTNPCPTGCELLAGHPYDSVMGEAIYRSHELTLARVHGHAVTLLWDEAANLDESDPVIASPLLHLTTPANQLLSAATAVRLGNALLAAAERAHELGARP